MDDDWLWLVVSVVAEQNPPGKQWPDVTPPGMH